MVKGGRLPAWVKKVADILSIRPVLTTKADGSMGVAGILKGTSNLTEKLSTFVCRKLDSVNTYTISIGHCNVPQDGEYLKTLIKKNEKNIDAIHLMEIGCALGVHAGPGSLAVGVQKKI